MLKYKIKESKEDYKDTIIEKSGVSVDITLGAMEKQANQVKKIKEELEAQFKLNEAQITNCEINYEGIADVTEDEEKRAIAITLRKGNLKENEEIAKKLAEIEQALEDYEKEVAQIKKTLEINE